MRGGNDELSELDDELGGVLTVEDDVGNDEGLGQRATWATFWTLELSLGLRLNVHQFLIGSSLGQAYPHLAEALAPLLALPLTLRSAYSKICKFNKIK